jgi:hypothetical protein
MDMSQDRRRANAYAANAARKSPKKAPLSISQPISSHPPMIPRYQIQHSQVLRYTTAAALSSVVITSANILDTMLVATTATVGYDLFDEYKIKMIRMWCPPSAATPTPSVTLSFPGAASGSPDQATFSDTSLSVSPAFIQCKPSAKSFISLWSSRTSTNTILMSSSGPCIIDVHLTVRTANQAPVVATVPLVAATVGEFYYRGLDGINVAASQFLVPTGIQQI